MPGPDTNSKIDVYNLGELGVNLTKSPIHIEDGELVAAQNAEFYLDEGVAALRKRLGLQRLNPVALGGAIRGVIGVPLPGPGRRAVFSGLLNGFQFYKTTDGATFTADATLGPRIGETGTLFGNEHPIPLGLQTAQQFFYAGGGAASNESLVIGHDGVAPYELARFAVAAKIRMLAVHLGSLYVTDYDGVGNSSVWQLDPIAGTQVIIGAALAENPCSGASYIGKVWIGTSAGKIYWCRPGGTSWTLDNTVGAGMGTVCSLAVFNGELYAGVVAAAATAAVIYKRTAAGVWTTDRTSTYSANSNKFDGLTVFQNELYAFADVVGTGYPYGFCQVHKRTAAGAWSVDKDLAAANSELVVGKLAVGASLYAGTDQGTVPGIWRKTGGLWTQVHAIPGHAGVMGVI